MTTSYLMALMFCVAALVLLIVLMRQKRLREKYAALWILLIVCVCIVGAFPVTVTWLAQVIGVQTPSNLLFAVSLVVLFFVCIQLSTEASAIEEEVRTIAEDAALTKLEVERLAARVSELEKALSSEQTDA